MPCGRKRYTRIRAVDVGRKGHHYQRIGVTPSGSVVKVGGLRTYKAKIKGKR